MFFANFFLDTNIDPTKPINAVTNIIPYLKILSLVCGFFISSCGFCSSLTIGITLPLEISCPHIPHIVSPVYPSSLVVASLAFITL